MGYILFLAYVRNNFKMEADKDIKEMVDTHSDREALDKVHTDETYESLEIRASNNITNIKEMAENDLDHEALDKVHTNETYESLKISGENNITKLTDAMEKVVKNIDATDNFIHFLHHNSWRETSQDIGILLLRVLTYATVLPILCIIVVNKLSGEDVNWKVFTTNSEMKKTIKSITLESSAKCLGFENIKDWKTLIMDKSKQEPAKVQRLNIG
jgi:hypothetical protein